MPDTTNLQLPYLAPGQAQKHVTVNESLRRLDAVVQLSVVSASTAVQPGSPEDGDVHILPPGKSGADWAGFADASLAYYRDGAWEQITPGEGWLAFVRDTDALMAFSGAGWSLFTAGRIVTVSATDKVLGRSSGGAGAAEEIACTAAGRALIDDADAAAQRTTLGLGTAAVKNTGTSGDAVPLLNQNATFSGNISFTGGEVSISNTQPFLRWRETDAATNQQYTYMMSNGGRWFITADLDAGGGGDLLMRGTRSGATWSSLELVPQGGAVTVNGLANFYAGADPVPSTDNARNLGSASFRFATVYAGTGAINTSDSREKTALEPIPDAVLRAVRRIVGGIGMFQWLASRAAKGDAARLHAGVTAQDVAAAFEAEGVDPRRWALFCADADGEGGERLSLRMDQLLVLALAALTPRAEAEC